MHQIIFVGAIELVQEMEPDDSPADNFPCMASPFFRDARAQLYALLTGCFFDDALALEELCHQLTEDGPFIYQLDPGMQDQLSRLEEDDIIQIASQWQACEEVESLDMETSDIAEFLFQFVHFCYTANADEELAVFFFGDS